MVVVRLSRSGIKYHMIKYLPPAIELACSVIYADIGAPITQRVILGREKFLGGARVPVLLCILLQKLETLLSQ